MVRLTTKKLQLFLSILSFYSITTPFAQTFTFSNYNSSPGAGSTSNYTETSSGKTMTFSTSMVGTAGWTTQCWTTTNTPAYYNGCFGGTGLIWAVNWGNLSSSVTGTATFSTAINGVSFTIYDINRNGTAASTVNLWTDVVEVVGYNGATAVTPTITQVTPTDQTISTSGSKKVITGNQPSLGGAVTVSFSSAITSLTLTYKSASSISSSSGSSTNPRQQYVIIGQITGTTALGVTLSDFGVECDRETYLLHFKTSSELNASHYQIAASNNGYDFENIKELAAQGTTNNPTEYNLVLPKNEYTYIKLDQYDFDGVKNELFMLHVPDCNGTIRPNVSISENGTVFLILPFTQPSSYSIYAIDGKLISQGLSSGVENEVLEFSSSHFSSGNYLIAIQNSLKTERLHFTYY